MKGNLKGVEDMVPPSKKALSLRGRFKTAIKMMNKT